MAGKIKPVGERVLLKPVEKEEKTASGIYLPKSEDKKEGVVEAIGNLKDKDPELSEGDKVFYGGYSSEELEVGSEKYLVVDYKDIIAKVEGGN